MTSISNLIRRRRMKIEISEEIESHIQERVDELVESGIPEREAHPLYGLGGYPASSASSPPPHPPFTTCSINYLEKNSP